MRSAKWHHPDTTFWFWTAAAFGLMIFGFAITMFAKSELESGIANERWPNDELEFLRKLFKSPLIVTYVAVLVVMVALLLVSRLNTPIFWACFIFNQSLTALSSATRPPRKSAPSWIGISTARSPDDTSALSPIESSHWGQR